MKLKLVTNTAKLLKKSDMCSFKYSLNQ